MGKADGGIDMIKFNFDFDIELCKKITEEIVFFGCICGLIVGLINHNWGQVSGFTMALLARI